MNLNEFVINRKKKKTMNVANIHKGVPMGPPKKAPPKRKLSTISSKINWGKNHINVLNNSSTLPSTSFSTNMENDHKIVIAITEGRGDARCEVGLASLDISTSNLILCQISDTQSYINTLTKINILNPTEIIIPSTFVTINTNRLIDKIKKQFPQIKLISVARKTFNKTSGMEHIQQLCLPSFNTICLGLQHRYYALAAASALLNYIQCNLNIFYANGTINVGYQESEGFAIIDVSTADRLELVASARPAQANRFSSLFGILNHCYTRLGSRRLRSTILQPPCSIALIEEHLDCVTELIKHPNKLLSIQAILQKIINLEQLLTITTIIPINAQNCSSRQLNYILLLNSLTDLIEPLKDILDNCQQNFFKELKLTLSSDDFVSIKKLIRDIICDKAHPAKGQDGIMERCFAIKSGINGLLDVVRKVYTERLDDMREYVKLLGGKYNLPLTLGNNNTKGYHIVFPLNNQQKRFMKKSDLPCEFIQVYRLAGSFTMKTPELINFSTRIDDIVLEILKISNNVIYKMLMDLKQYLRLFYKLCEDIAKLDMLQSLAQVTIDNNYIRPKFGEFTEISYSHHPLLDFLCSNPPITNPISACKFYNFHIITGPNGSGKSIYIRQVMLLQIMAQIGCYIPAKSAIIKPADRMFARIYLEDDMEFGASSFILEIKEIKYMITTMTNNSLFIIDEICRSTSLEEGTALAMALCEQLLSTSCFIYITTHFTLLTKLYDLYYNVKVWQMETNAIGDNPRELRLDFQYNLIPGVTNLERYGVYLVRNIWPETVVKNVYKILNKIKNTSKKGNFMKLDERIRLKYELEANLFKLKAQKKLTQAEINKYLNYYQNELVKLGCNLNIFNHLNKKEIDKTFNNEFELINQRNEGIFISLPINQENCEGNQQENLSDFLNESDSNINKLIPEVNIEYLNNSSISNLNNRNDESMICNNQNDEIQSIIDEFNSYSDEFFDCNDTTFETNISCPNFKQLNDNNSARYSSPTINTIECPNISLITQNTHETEINYSPLCSPISNNNFNEINSSKVDYDVLNNMNVIELTESSENNNASKKQIITTTTTTTITSDEGIIETDNKSSSIKESNEKSLSVNSKRPVRLIEKRFIQPKKLTKRQIQEEFNEQDRKIYENSTNDPENLPKYLQQILNRPSIKQIQSVEHLALLRKTDNGNVEVIPAPPKKIRKQQSDLMPRLLSNTNTSLDLSIFSDKNAQSFKEFLNSSEKNYKKFNFHLNSSSANDPPKFHFNPTNS